MPLALSGAFTILLAQAAALCGSATMPPPSPLPKAAIVQRDDAFVIVSATKAVPEAASIPGPIRPASLKLGRTVRIDPALLAAGTPHARGATR